MKRPASLRNRLFALFALIFCMIIILQTALWRYTVDSIIYPKSKAIFDEVNYQFAKQFDNRLAMCTKISDGIKNSTVIKTVLHEILIGATNYRTGNSKITTEIIKLLNTETVNLNLVKDVRIHMADHEPIICYIRGGNRAPGLEMPFDQIDPAYFNYVWRTDSSQGIHMTTYIDEGSRILGLLEVTFSSNLFDGIVDTSGEGLDMQITIEDPSGLFYYSASVGDSEQIDRFTGDIVSLLPLANGRWTVRGVLSGGYIEKEIEKFSVLWFILFFCISCLLLFVMLSIYTSVLHPLRHVITGMENVQIGNLDFRLNPGQYTEFDIVNRNFNYMAQKMKELISTIVEQKEEYQELQILALNSKFNPHFLYNTLDMIKWELVLANRPELSELIVSFSDLLRYSAAMDIEFSPIRKDLQYIEDYLSIQNKRFNNKLHYRFTVANELSSFQIPKLLIQPLVENSIKHGFEKMQQTGFIAISVYGKESDIVLEVTDDGIGMQDENFYRVTASLEAADRMELGQKNPHLGLFLVNSIVKFYYGERYGVTITRPAQGGLTVSVTIARSPDFQRLRNIRKGGEANADRFGG